MLSLCLFPQVQLQEVLVEPYAERESEPGAARWALGTAEALQLQEIHTGVAPHQHWEVDIPQIRPAMIRIPRG